MKVLKTIKIEMTEEEREAIKTIYRMLYVLEWDDERAVADELDCDDFGLTRAVLFNLYRLGGGREEDLE
jgi:hypothetical protein